MKDMGACTLSIITIVLLIVYSTVSAAIPISAVSAIPRVTQKTMPEMLAYLKALGPMMNITRLGEGVGNATDVQATLYGNNTYVAFIASNSSGRNHVYIQISPVRPLQFSQPVELTNSSRIVNASHLGIAAFNTTDILVIWQDTTSGKGSIWISSSDNSGRNFTTYQQSFGTDASDPKIVTDGKYVFYSWLQLTAKNCTTAVGSGNTTKSTHTPTTCIRIFAHGHRW